MLDGDNFDEIEKYCNKQSKSGFFVEEFLRTFLYAEYIMNLRQRGAMGSGTFSSFISPRKLY